MNEPRFAFATETRDKANNQDGGVAERLIMADGNFAYVAAVADGVTNCEFPREAATLALSALRRAVEAATTDILSDAAGRAVWLRDWTEGLDDVVKRRAADGFSTLAALLLFRTSPEEGDESGWGLVSLNVGDSPSFLVSPAVSGCMSLRPDEGERKNAADGGGLARAVGLPRGDGIPLLDVGYQMFPAGFIGWFWVGSDGVFNFVMGGDLRELCLGGAHSFRHLPNEALNLSLKEAQLSRKRKLDNATVALIGLNVPEKAEPTFDQIPPPPPPRRHVNWLKVANWAIGALLVVLLFLVTNLAARLIAGRSDHETAPQDEPPPANETPAIETPANETPVNETPVNETPTIETPANETTTPSTSGAESGAVTENGAPEASSIKNAASATQNAADDGAKAQ